MKIDGTNYDCFAAAVAARSAEHPYPRIHSTPNERARYVAEVLEILLDDADVQVVPIPYPSQAKTPLLICIGDNAKRLFWFNSWASVTSFAEELVPLLYDTARVTACVS